MERMAGRTGKGAVHAVPLPVMPRTVTIGLLFASGDYAGWSTHGPNARYLAVLFLVAAVIADYRRTVSSTQHTVALTLPVYLFLAWLWVLAIRALSMGTWANSTTVLIVPPLIILAASLLINSGWSANSRWPAVPRTNPTWISYAPYAAALVFGGLSLIDTINAPFGRPLNLLNHEKTFIAVYILLMPRYKGSLPVKVVVGAASVLSLYKYPAATTVIALVLALGALVLLRISRNPRPWSLLAFSLFFVFVITGVLKELLDSFYKTIGRGDNNETRLSLWDQAWSLIQPDPLAGGAMELRITGVGRIDGVLQLVPFHNSYLTLMAAGGLVALVLFSAFITAVFFRTLKRPRPFRTRYAAQWLPAILAALVSMTVNPVLDKLGSAVFVYVLLAVAVVNLTRVSREWTAGSLEVQGVEPGSQYFAGTPFAAPRKSPW
ncbi:O-antigen ligase [Arthrobacter sp. RT-1]|uniref:O-antigen ligase family protein n=1 Tax=Arthrobacter sp. RT-1 TaxID=2292263 RepID=UPI0011C0630C|nr:O-antigen ligase family protein [Arthrobacter sp. RT-1]